VSAEPPESERRRRLRLGILGCGTILLVFLVLGSVVAYVIAHHPQTFRSAFGAIFSTLEDDLMKNFSPEVTGAQREEFRAARGRFQDAWISGKIDLNAADALRRRLMKESQKNRLSPSDVEGLTLFLNRLSGGTGGARNLAPS
jgi:hypothetical protein